MQNVKLYENVMKRLEATSLSYEEVGGGAGESKRTVEKITRREIKDPGVSHCENIAGFFQELDATPGETERERYDALMARRAAGGAAGSSTAMLERAG
jgi:hypothetical protein